MCYVFQNPYNAAEFKLRSCKDFVDLKSKMRWQVRVGYLLKQGTTWNDLKRPTTSKKKSEMTYNQEETSKTQPTMTWKCLQQAKKRRKTTNNKQILRLFYNNNFPPNIWFQSFEHCFTENHGGNRVPGIYYHASSVNCHMYFFWDIRFNFFCLGFVSAGKGRGYFF